nr:putative reverse transcriptase domain-containing protein [Tanacetum cinerariifolium]
MPSAIALAIAKRVMACNILRIWIRGNLGERFYHGAESYIGRESRLTIFSCSKVQEYWAKGHHVFLAQISATREDGKPEGKQDKDVPIIQDFPKLFSEKLPGLPPARPIEFQINQFWELHLWPERHTA